MHFTYIDISHNPISRFSFKFNGNCYCIATYVENWQGTPGTAHVGDLALSFFFFFSNFPLITAQYGIIILCIYLCTACGLSSVPQPVWAFCKHGNMVFYSEPPQRLPMSLSIKAKGLNKITSLLSLSHYLVFTCFFPMHSLLTGLLAVSFSGPLHWLFPLPEMLYFTSLYLFLHSF